MREGRSLTGFLGRLRRDRRGNALAIMAAMLVPLVGFSGSAIDLARLYVVKARLQQACDAGALAGRKTMTGSGDTLDDAAKTQANAFFNNNFRSNFYQSTNVSFTPAKTSDSQVSGTAQATVPMAVMGAFGVQARTVKVSCEARYDVADADILFVLDTTGSMACAAADTSSNCDNYVIGNTTTYTRADGSTGYKSTEKSNARIKALRTSVEDFYSTLASNADPTTHIRYGFVPYTSSVNVGKVLYQADPTWLASNTWKYQSREKVGSTWYYRQVAYDISNYVKGGSVDDPSKTGTETSKWQGCIEERQTTANTTTFSQSSLPADLDPDLAPSSDATRWKPMWPDVIYTRGNNAVQGTTNNDPDGNFPNTGKIPQYLAYHIFYSCGKQAQRLKTMTAGDVHDYVYASDFVPWGGTYHDTGMIWGMRLLSPSGLFAGDTAAWSGHNAPSRHLIFMTDGVMEPNMQTYGMYGVEQYDQRVTGGNTSTTQAAFHNARFLAACNAAKAKNRNITIWVIAFGQTLTDEMKKCAYDSSHVFYASDDAALDAAFVKIAKRVAMLRLSQ